MEQHIIQKMRTFDQWLDKPVADITALINRGHAIKKEDEKILSEKWVMRSHFDLSDFDREALYSASQYDIMLEFDGDEPLDEEE